MHTVAGTRPYQAKTAAQIAIMAENAQLFFTVFSQLKPFMEPGSTGIRIQEYCLEQFRRLGFRPILQGYRDFPAQVCVSRNRVAVHGIPDLVPLRPGDLVTVDMAGTRRGFCADAAWTFLIPGGADGAEALRQAAWSACLAGIRAGGEQARKTAIGRAVQGEAERRGFRVQPRFTGHGIGRQLHEAPLCYFVAAPQPDDRLPPGTVLNIEPVLCPPSPEGGTPPVSLAADGWSWVLGEGLAAAQFELSLCIPPEGAWQVLNFPDQDLVLASSPPF